MRRMYRRILPLALLGVVASFMSGCNTLGGTKSRHGSFWSRNLKNKLKVVERDATDAYRSFDRHFLNQDWDDPWLD